MVEFSGKRAVNLTSTPNHVQSRNMKLILTFLVCTALLGGHACAELSFPGETIDEWHGFKRHKFQADGCAAWIVEPKTALPGQPWSWCMEFPDAFTERCAAPQLLAAGFHHVHIVVGNTFGSPDAVKHFIAFYDLLIAHGLAKKTALIGLSRGGLYAYRFAAEHPECVAVIYGDAPLCDIKTVRGGKGYGKGNAGEWATLMKAYGFKDEGEALAYRGNPVDTLAPLAQAKVALIHVIGDADDVVPPAKNSAIIEQRYQQLGGEIQIIHKPGVSHHPHGLDDPKPVVNFILKHASQP
jgi:pimeloyl-ACP methyl ester carboxylesterase